MKKKRFKMKIIIFKDTHTHLAFTYILQKLKVRDGVHLLLVDA